MGLVHGKLKTFGPDLPHPGRHNNILPSSSCLFSSSFCIYPHFPTIIFHLLVGRGRLKLVHNGENDEKVQQNRKFGFAVWLGHTNGPLPVFVFHFIRLMGKGFSRPPLPLLPALLDERIFYFRNFGLLVLAVPASLTSLSIRRATSWLTKDFPGLCYSKCYLY